MGFFRHTGENLHLTDVIESGEPFNAIMYHSPTVNFNSHSTIICRPGEQAVFVKNGVVYKVLSGGRERVKTPLHPILKELSALLTSGKDSYTCDIYFVRTTINTPMPWGTQITCQDPVYKIMAQMGTSGSYSYRINDAALFLPEIFGTKQQHLTSADISNYLRDHVNMEISSAIVASIVSSGSDLLNIQMNLPSIAEKARQKINLFAGKMGIAISDLSISQLTFVDSNIRDRLEKLKLHCIDGQGYDVVAKWDAAQAFAENQNAGGMMPGMMFGAMLNGNGNGMPQMMGGMVSNNPQSMPNTQSAGNNGRNFCPSCGNKLEAGMRFCPGCGAKQ